MKIKYQIILLDENCPSTGFIWGLLVQEKGHVKNLKTGIKICR
jgi:hypothetical protein